MKYATIAKLKLFHQLNTPAGSKLATAHCETDRSKRLRATCASRLRRRQSMAQLAATPRPVRRQSNKRSVGPWPSAALQLHSGGDQGRWRCVQGVDGPWAWAWPCAVQDQDGA